jgi:hypothetical protein
MKIRTVNYDIAILVAENGGYCPRTSEKNDDTKCMCKEFREQESGPCRCGRYEKILED